MYTTVRNRPGQGGQLMKPSPALAYSFYMAAAMAEGSGGVLKVVWVEGGMRYSQRNANGQWSPASSWRVHSQVFGGQLP